MGEAQFNYKGRVVKSYSNETDPISATCVSPDDTYVVGCRKGTIVLWNFTSGEEWGKLEGHRSDVSCCSMNDTLLATGSMNGIVHLWKYRELKRVARIELPSPPINTLALSPNGQFLGVGFADAKPRIYTIYNADSSLLQGPSYKELVGHTDVVTDMKFSSNGINLMTASKDGSVRLWRASTGECILTIEPGEGEVMSANFCGGQSNALFLTGNGFTVWDLNENVATWKLEGGFMFATSSTLTKAIVAVTTNARLSCFNLSTQMETVKKGTAHTDDILSCITCSSGAYFLTSGADGKIMLWE